MNSNPCVIPTERKDFDGDDRWMSIHRRFLQECREKDPESKKTCLHNYLSIKSFHFSVLFFGDDILSGLIFTEVYRMLEEMHLLNFSIRGDLIQNILWRIINGEMELRPKIVVLHCGTNNTPTDSAEEISEGILECVNQIRKKFDGFVVLLTLLPRGSKPNVLREKNEAVNKIIQEKCVGMPKVQVIDISNGLLQADKTISHHDMYDYLNLTNAAAKKVFEPVWELLQQILNENEKEILLTPSE